MTRTTTCDGCGKQRDPHPDGWVGWLKVEVLDLDSYGGAGAWDFCSVSCLTSWVESVKD